MLRIARSLVDDIVAHARRDHPLEACGVIAGTVGSDIPRRFIPLRNAASSPTFYEVDSLDLLHLYCDLDERGEEPVVIYHSHTATAAYPSPTDVTLAGEPGAHYVVVSTRDGAAVASRVEFRSFRILDSVVYEESVRILGSGEGT